MALQSTTNGLRRTCPGTPAAAEQADPAFSVNGQLIELSALAGQLLARLDLTDFQNTVAERQARFDLTRT